VLIYDSETAVSGRGPHRPSGTSPTELGKSKSQDLPLAITAGARPDSFPNLLGKCPKGDGGNCNIGGASNSLFALQHAGIHLVVMEICFPGASKGFGGPVDIS
jgi:hypothetical protein